MNKTLFKIALILGVIIFIAKAEALVSQSASKAISYRNTVTSSSGGRTPSVRANKPVEALKTTPKQVDIRSGFSKKVVLSPKEELEVIVAEKQDYSWDVSYDSSCFTMVGNSASEGTRTIKFKQKNGTDCTIFLDSINKDGSVVENKAVYIKVR